MLEAKDVKESVTQLTDSVVRNPDAMLLVTRLREKSAAAHARALQVSIYMIVFARFLELAREELELLGMVGLLQDVGKTRLPASIMEKDDHAHAGGGRDLQEPRPARRGDPQGDSGHAAAAAGARHPAPRAPGRHRLSEGPEGRRRSACTARSPPSPTPSTPSPRCGRKGEPLSPSAALSYLYKERGTGYHSDLVEQFIQCVGVFPVGSVVELNSGETGLVITQNLVRRLKPRVMIVLDGKGNPMRPHKILDLDRDPKCTPEEPYRIKRTLEQTKLQVNPKELFM